MIPFVVRTRNSQRLTSGVIVAHLWWLSKGRCSQSQFKQRLCLKWHELYRGNEWGFDLSLALHENSCTWEAWRSTTTNGYTCIWQNLPPGCLDLFCNCPALSSNENPNLLYILDLLLAFVSYSYPLKKIPPFEIFLFSVSFVSWEMTTKWHKWLTAMY